MTISVTFLNWVQTVMMWRSLLFFFFFSKWTRHQHKGFVLYAFSQPFLIYHQRLMSVSILYFHLMVFFSSTLEFVLIPEPIILDFRISFRIRIPVFFSSTCLVSFFFSWRLQRKIFVIVHFVRYIAKEKYLIIEHNARS